MLAAQRDGHHHAGMPSPNGPDDVVSFAGRLQEAAGIAAPPGDLAAPGAA